MLRGGASPDRHRATVAAVAEGIELDVERFAAGGEAICRAADGRIVFIAGAVPGDRVRAEIVEEHDRWARGTLIDVMSAGGDRIDARCPARTAGCGGCDWAEVAPAAQLTHKVAIVHDALRRTGGVDVEVIAAGSVPAVGYRSGVRVVADIDRRAAFRRARSAATVSARGCPVAHPLLHPLLDALRCAPGTEVALRVSIREQTSTARAIGGAELHGLPHECRIGDQAVLHEVVNGVRLQVSAASFFQSGPAALALLAATIRDIAPEAVDADHLVDAYGGIGALSLLVAGSQTRITVVEASAAACADARANLDGRANSTVVKGEVARWRPRPTDRVDVVIADPARTGLGRPGVSAVVAAAPEVVALVGCDPVAFARDLALLTARGYRCEQVAVIDLFPDTHHVECVGRLVRDGSGTLSR